MISRWGSRLLLMLLCGLGSACSSFDARWKAAAGDLPAAKTERWVGRWASEKHHTVSGGIEGGALRAVTEPAPGNALTAHFHANWLIFSGNYSVTFQPKPARGLRTGERDFGGTQPLPKIFGGIYRYDVSLRGDQLTARYASSYDYGTFTLRRLDGVKDYTPERARH